MLSRVHEAGISEPLQPGGDSRRGRTRRVPKAKWPERGVCLRLHQQQFSTVTRSQVSEPPMFLFLFFYFEMGSCHVAQAGLELLDSGRLPLSLKMVKLQV